MYPYGGIGLGWGGIDLCGMCGGLGLCGTSSCPLMPEAAKPIACAKGIRVIGGFMVIPSPTDLSACDRCEYFEGCETRLWLADPEWEPPAKNARLTTNTCSSCASANCALKARLAAKQQSTHQENNSRWTFGHTLLCVFVLGAIAMAISIWRVLEAIPR